MKKTFITLTMGIAMSAMLISCGEKKAAATEQTEETTEQTAKKVTPKPADLKVYKSSDLTAAKTGTAVNVGFDNSVMSTTDNMMEGNTSVEALYFDHKLNMIGTASFKGCTSLKEVHFDDVCNVIGDEAFAGCTSLKEFQCSTSTYGLDAFNGCTSLEKVMMDDTGWKIRQGALANCTSLKTIILPMTIEDIEDGAFEGSNAIEELAIPINFKDAMYKHCAGAKGIKKVYILTPFFYNFPIAASAKAFNKAQCVAYVPDAQIDQFKADAEWSKFADIKPLSESGYFTAECSIK